MKKKQSSDELQVEDAIQTLKEYLGSQSNPTWFLHTGNLALDYIISGRVDGQGGWPGTKITEIFGDPSTGKSLLLALAAASMQREGGLFILADAEGRWDMDFAAVHGVIPESTVIFEPATIEEFTAKTVELLEKASGKFSKILVALDSVAILSTEHEVDTVGSKEDQGKRAKRLHAAMRVLPSKVKEANALMLISNHVIANPNITYGNPKTTPGGGAVKFQASVRVEMLSTKAIKLEGKERPIGNTLRCVCTKNSIQPPYGSCSFDLYWARGIDKFSGIIDLALDLGIIDRSGSWFVYEGKNCREKDLLQHEVMSKILDDPKWLHPYFKEV